MSEKDSFRENPHEWEGFDKSNVESCRTRARRESFRFKPRDEWCIGQCSDWAIDPWPVGMSSKLFDWFLRRYSSLAKTPEDKQAVVDDFVEVRTEQLHSDRHDEHWFFFSHEHNEDLSKSWRAFPPHEIEKALRGRFLGNEMPDWVRNWFSELERNPKSTEAADRIGGWYLEYGACHNRPENGIGAMAKMLGYWLTMHTYWKHPEGFYDFSEFYEGFVPESSRVDGDVKLETLDITEHPESYPAELVEFVKSWKEIADSMFKKWGGCSYYVKGAEIRFRYKGRNYLLERHGFGDGSNEFFELIEADIERNLVEFGAERICYTGMLD